MYGKKNPAVSVTPADAKTLDLHGKNVTVIGGTGGLGRAIAQSAAAKGAAVTVVGRTFRDKGVANMSFVPADFTTMASAAEVGRKLGKADVIVLSHGIVPRDKREESPDGIELDMAVSCLSRLVLLRELLPRQEPGTRVFVYGMPGNGSDDHKLDDLNCEKGYAGGFGFTHMNTVICNEAIVHHLAAQEKAKGEGKGVALFGMNPGLLVTDIRAPMHGGRASFKGRMMEGLVGLFTPSLPKYADRMVALFFAPGLQAHSGAMFGQSGGAILPNKEFAAPGSAATWYNRMAELVKAKAGL